MVFVECWFAPWPALEGGVDLVELRLHGFDPIEFPIVGDLPNLLVQFDLGFLGFDPLVVLNTVVDIEDHFWDDVERGEDKCIEPKGKTCD